MQRYYKITPSNNPNYDFMYVKADESWKPALDAAESVLEDQFLRIEDGALWNDIKVTIECVELSEAEIYDLGNEL